MTRRRYRERADAHPDHHAFEAGPLVVMTAVTLYPPGWKHPTPRLALGNDGP